MLGSCQKDTDRLVLLFVPVLYLNTVITFRKHQVTPRSTGNGSGRRSSKLNAQPVIASHHIASHPSNLNDSQLNKEHRAPVASPWSSDELAAAAAAAAAMSSAAAADYGFKRFRVSKACVVCRLRKTKCNGEQPCDRCKAHSAECVYETVEAPARNPSRTEQGSSDADPDTRLAKRLKSGERVRRAPAKRPVLYDPIDGDDAQDRDEQEGNDMHDGIRAHDQTTGNMQFYGFTSNFNFQHRLSHTIQALRLRDQYPLTRPQDPHQPGRNGPKAPQLPESMRTWGHQDIIFRQNLGGAGNFPTLDACKDSTGDSTFLPPSIVERFVENFLVLIQPQVEVVPKWQIIKWMRDAKALGHVSRGFNAVPTTLNTGPNNGPVEGSRRKPAMRSNELATFYVILALGALMDEGDWEDVFTPVSMSREGAIQCGVTLFLQAKSRGDEVIENSSMASARCLLLMAFFSLQWSSPNVAYLYLGYAARMCISIGLHRETFYTPDSPRSAEHRRLWWTCYCVERRVSTWFGQPSSIRDDDVSTRLPPPDQVSCDCHCHVLPRPPTATGADSISSSHVLQYAYDDFLRVNARIARVCSDMSRLSSNPPTAAADVMLASEAMNREMLRIRQEAPPELSIGLQDREPTEAEMATDNSDLVVRRYAVNTCEYSCRPRPRPRPRPQPLVTES